MTMGPSDTKGLISLALCRSKARFPQQLRFLELIGHLHPMIKDQSERNTFFQLSLKDQILFLIGVFAEHARKILPTYSTSHKYEMLPYYRSLKYSVCVYVCVCEK
jgi:hypothetical protein